MRWSRRAMARHALSWTVTLLFAPGAPNKKGRSFAAPSNVVRRTSAGRIVASSPPHIDAGEQEQPHHVYKVPVPGRSLEAEMQLRRERTAHRPDQAHRGEDGADDDVEPVEAGRHEEGRAIDVVGEAEACMHVLIGLAHGEQDAEDDGAQQA